AETDIEELLFTAFWTVFIISWTAGLLKTSPKNLSGWETHDLSSFTAGETPGSHAPHPAIPVAARTLMIQE
nr:hypothetical protein [Candidatus Brocadiales bacterium]